MSDNCPENCPLCLNEEIEELEEREPDEEPNQDEDND
jgi:hypothetical protein